MNIKIGRIAITGLYMDLPLMTCPKPTLKVNGSWPGSFVLQNFSFMLRFFPYPVQCTVTLCPCLGMMPLPALMSVLTNPMVTRLIRFNMFLFEVRFEESFVKISTSIHTYSRGSIGMGWEALWDGGQTLSHDSRMDYHLLRNTIQGTFNPSWSQDQFCNGTFYRENLAKTLRVQVAFTYLLFSPIGTHSYSGTGSTERVQSRGSFFDFQKWLSTNQIKLLPTQLEGLLSLLLL